MPKKGYKKTEDHINKTSWPKGKTHSEETRDKLSQKLKGRVFSEETKRKMSESGKKKKLSEEHKRKIAEAGKRRQPPSEETRRKLAESASNRTGFRHSEETKRKMSESRKGKKPTVTDKWRESAAKRGEQMKGKKRTPESIENHRLAMLARPPFSDQHRENLSISGKGKHSGINHPNYIDGRKSYTVFYPAEFTDYLKKKVRIRDKYTCQACFNSAKGKAGHVHHIDGNKQNCSMENLTLICISCHNRIHSSGGNQTERVLYFRGLLLPENRPLRSIQ